MKKALILFGSTTGNTEDMANTIKQALEEAGFEAEVKNVTDAAAEDLTANHDLLLLGCPAYGDDTVELQEDFQEFLDRLGDIDLHGKKIGIFAPGDSSYEHFCGSVDLLENRMNEFGGELAVDGLKVDGDPADSGEEIRQWAGQAALALGS